ncbi:MAG: HAD family hydrolase [Micropepsaceae bacterium]
MTKRYLICDLDNTLYDWVSFFVPAFYAMVDVAVQIAKCDREQLLDDFREVHRIAHNSEEPFALLHTRTIRNLYPQLSPRELRKLFDPAFHAFNSARKRSLVLYPEVKETLDLLSRSKIKLIAHTESRLFGVLDRLRRLHLSDHFCRVYCRERTSSLGVFDLEGDGWFDQFPMGKIVELSDHQAKPDPAVLLEICARENVAPSDAAYIGDSVAKDVVMAKKANIFAVWAAYGSKHDQDLYQSLVRVSHWTEEEVERERRLAREAIGVPADFVARSSFSEVVTAIGLS